MLMRFPNCRIILRVTLREDIAAASALLLCLSPASVFLTYAYTESLFQLLTFTGVWLLLVFEAIAAALAFAGSCAVRSNGAHCKPQRHEDLGAIQLSAERSNVVHAD